MMHRRLLTATLAILLVSCGSNPDGPSGLGITVTQPPAGGASAEGTFTIEWQVTGEGGGAVVALFYDTDANPVSGLVPIASGLDAGAGSYVWDCSGIMPGVYYIRAVVSESGSSDSDYSDGALTIGASGPAVYVIDPPAGGDSTDTSYEITWQTFGLEDPMIDLYYDTDTDPSSGLVAIIGSLSDSGTYTWDCTAVPDGYYYVRAVAGGTVSDYSDGTLAIDHGSLQPSITVVEPSADGDLADNAFTIEWESTGPPSAVIDLYYDVDSDPGSGLVQIEAGLADDGFYSWDCSDVPGGEYYVYAVISTLDRRATSPVRIVPSRASASDYSDGTLTIAHTNPWTMEVTAPPAGGADADENYTIQWISSAPTTETVDLYYAADTTGSELYTAAVDVPCTGSYDWDCSMVEPGSWFVYAVVGEGKGPGSDWSDGALTITHVSEYTFSFTAPPPEGATADESYVLEWTTDAPGEAMVALYYCTTTEPGGVLEPITTTAPNTGSYSWFCSAVPEDSYYIYGMVYDATKERPRPGRGSGYAWSEGTLTIDHDIYSMTVTAPPSGGATADSSYTVLWTAEGGPSSVVDLYYDEDTDPGEMWLIESGLEDTGSYLWNTAQVVGGSYYVYGLIYDPTLGRPRPGTDAWAGDYSDGMLTVNHTYFYVIVTAPPSWGGYAEDQYTIQWAAAGPAGSTIDLYYDTDTDPSSGLVPIASDLTYSSFQYLWNCSTTPEGVYYIYAILSDGTDTTADYSDGTLTINRDPLWLYITEPNPGGAYADASFTIEWMSEGPAGRTLDLFYDTDTDPASGLVGIVSDLVTSDPTDSYLWNCSGVPEGVYYIYGLLWDPVTRADSFPSYSEGTLTIDHP